VAWRRSPKEWEKIEKRRKPETKFWDIPNVTSLGNEELVRDCKEMTSEIGGGKTFRILVKEG
jgi:hypothetical protein